MKNYIHFICPSPFSVQLPRHTRRHNIANTLKNIVLAIGLCYTGRRNVETTLAEIERIGRERAGEPVNEHDETRI